MIKVEPFECILAVWGLGVWRNGHHHSPSAQLGNWKSPHTHKRTCTQCSYALLNALWPFLSLPLCKYIWLSTALIFLLSVTQVINITGYRMGLGFNNNNNNKGVNLYYAFLNPFKRVALGRVSFTVHTQYLRFNLTISVWEKIKVFQFEAAY